MSLISSLPYDILFQVEDYLSNRDLETLINTFFDFHDNSILFATYVKLSEKKIIISDTPSNELLSENDHVYLGSTECIQFLKGIMMFDESYGTNIFPKSIVFDLILSKEKAFVEIHEKMFDFLKNERHKRRFISSRFDLVVRSIKAFSTEEVSIFLRNLAVGIGPRTRGIIFLGSIINIDLLYVAALFDSLQCLDLNDFHQHSKVEYLPQTVENFVFKDVQLNGKKLPDNTKSLRLKNSTFNNCLGVRLPVVEELALCNIPKISNFVLQNWSSTLVSLVLDNVELKVDNLKLRELHNLERLKLIDLSNEFGYEFKCPPLLHLLYIQDKYLPYLSIDFQSLPETLICLTLRGDLPFKFDNLTFPRNLNSLVLQGGEGIFQCENFKCPPKLQKLIITLQKFRNVHKFKLAKTLREVNLSSNNITKISTMKFPCNILTLCLSNNNFSSINGVQFPLRMKQIDLTQKYSLMGVYDFTKYSLLSTANIFISDSNKFVFNGGVKIINDYDWRVDRKWKNREIEYFY